MSEEVVFILEPDTGRVCVESSNVSLNVVAEIKRDLGQGATLNCGRPNVKSDKSVGNKAPKKNSIGNEPVDSDKVIHLFRLYHYSTVDGPGRRSVIQFAGCSIRCPGCYVPETHERGNGEPVSIHAIVREIDKKKHEHDGVTILGGEPFDQIDGLKTLVENLKEKSYHLTIYSGNTLEKLLSSKNEKIEQILAKTDLLIDGGFDRELTNAVGEYRGSSNQNLYTNPLSN